MIEKNLSFILLEFDMQAFEPFRRHFFFFFPRQPFADPSFSTTLLHDTGHSTSRTFRYGPTLLYDGFPAEEGSDFDK